MSPEQLDIIIAGSKEDFPVIVGELHQHILDAAAVGVRRKVRGETHFQDREETPELPGMRNN